MPNEMRRRKQSTSNLKIQYQLVKNMNVLKRMSCSIVAVNVIKVAPEEKIKTKNR